MVQVGSEWTWFSSRESRLRISRYPGEDAFLSSHKVGDCTQHRFSSCKGFLLPPHPQVGTPVSRKRFARFYATSLMKKRNLFHPCQNRSSVLKNAYIADFGPWSALHLRSDFDVQIRNDEVIRGFSTGWFVSCN